MTAVQTVLLASTYNFSTAVLVLNLPLRALSLGAGAFHLGLIGGVFSLSFTLSAVLFGRLSDRIERGRMMAAGVACCALGALTATLAGAWGWLLPAAVCVGLANALYWPAMEARVAEGADDDQLGGHLSRFNISWGTGAATGTFLAGMLAARHPNLPFYAASGACAALTIVLLTIQNGTGRAPQAHDFPTQQARESTPTFLLLARLTSFGIVFCVASTRWLFPKSADLLGLSESTVGVLLGVLLAGQTLTFWVLGRFRQWQYRFPVLPVVLLLCVCGLGLARTATRPSEFFLAFLIVGISNGTAFTMGLFYSLHGSSAKGGQAGLHESVIGLGSVAGPFAGGLAAKHVSMSAVYLLNMSVAAVVVAGVCFLWWRRRVHIVSVPRASA